MTNNGLPPTNVESSQKNSYALSIAALILGTLSLGLATIPAIALDEPLPHPFADADQNKPPQEREGGWTFRFKDFSVNVGGKLPKEASQEDVAKLELTDKPAHWFTISAIGFSLIGIVVGAIGQHREGHTGLTVGSLTCCIAAITWQYIVIGLIAGAALAVFLILAHIFS